VPSPEAACRCRPRHSPLDVVRSSHRAGRWEVVGGGGKGGVKIYVCKNVKHEIGICVRARGCVRECVCVCMSVRVCVTV